MNASREMYDSLLAPVTLSKKASSYVCGKSSLNRINARLSSSRETVLLPSSSMRSKQASMETEFLLRYSPIFLKTRLSHYTV